MEILVNKKRRDTRVSGRLQESRGRACVCMRRKERGREKGEKG